MPARGGRANGRPLLARYFPPFASRNSLLGPQRDDPRGDGTDPAGRQEAWLDSPLCCPGTTVDDSGPRTLDRGEVP